jgi:AAA domain-containing protein
VTDVSWTPEAAAWAQSVGMDTTGAAETQRMALNYRARFALPLKAFIAQGVEGAEPLIGTVDNNVLPSGGLMLLGGQAGTGKTTFALDMAMHLVSPIDDWLGFPIPEPLRVLVIENEGPREPFRRKLERKYESWPHPMLGELYVCTFNWAAVSLRDVETRTRLRQFIEAMHVDVVIADPLSGLGMEGVGSPAETQAFVDLLKLVGLGSDVAWIILHHFRKEAVVDEIEAFRGGWSGHGDALLALKSLEGDRARLSFPKLRWADAHEPLILRRDRDTAGFTVLAEGAGERDYAGEILAFLADGAWRTVSELERSKEKGGIGANRAKVLETLDLLTKQRVLEFAEGPAGRSSDAKCWRLYEASYNPVQPTLSGEGWEGCTAGDGVRSTSPPVQPPDPGLYDPSYNGNAWFKERKAADSEPPGDAS